MLTRYFKIFSISFAATFIFCEGVILLHDQQLTLSTRRLGIYTAACAMASAWGLVLIESTKDKL